MPTTLAPAADLVTWTVAYAAAEEAHRAARLRGDYGMTSVFAAIARSGITKAQADEVTASVVQAVVEAAAARRLAQAPVVL